MKIIKDLNILSDITNRELSYYVTKMMQAMEIKSLPYTTFLEYKLQAANAEIVELLFKCDEELEPYQLAVNVTKACNIRKRYPEYAELSTQEMMEQEWWDDYSGRGNIKKK